MENVITLGNLIGLLFIFCLPLLSILFLKTKRNDLARPVMGTIFLVLSVCHMYVVCPINCVGGITWPTRMLKVFFGWLNRCGKDVTPMLLISTTH